MKDSIIYFRKSGINKQGLFMTKSADVTKIYKICKKIKYLRATSGAVIDTGYTWTSNKTKVEIKFSNLNTTSATIFGSEDRVNNSTETSGKYSLIGHSSINNGLKMLWYIGKQASLGQSNLYSIDDVHTMIIETDPLNSRVTCTIDGDTQIYNNSSAVIVNKTLSNSIFGSHWMNGYTQFAPCDVYYCKMWDNGVLVRDLLPVKSGQIVNGITLTENGFYDYVEKEFHGRASDSGTISYVED